MSAWNNSADFSFATLEPGAEVLVRTGTRYGGPGVLVIGRVVKVNHRGNVIVEHSGYQAEFRAGGIGAGQNRDSLLQCTPTNRQAVLDETEKRQLAMEMDRINWSRQSLATLRAVSAALELQRLSQKTPG